MSPTKGPHQAAIGMLLNLLPVFIAGLEQARSRALMVVSGEGGFRLSGGTVLATDIAIASRAAVMAAKKANRFTEGPPIVAIEVLSESNTRREIQRKTALLLDAGAEQVWLVNPANASIHVESNRTVVAEVFAGPDAVLIGHGTLEGLNLPLSEVFAEE